MHTLVLVTYERSLHFPQSPAIVAGTHIAYTVKRVPLSSELYAWRVSLLGTLKLGNATGDWYFVFPGRFVQMPGCRYCTAAGGQRTAETRG